MRKTHENKFADRYTKFHDSGKFILTNNATLSAIESFQNVMESEDQLQKDIDAGVLSPLVISRLKGHSVNPEVAGDSMRINAADLVLKVQSTIIAGIKKYEAKDFYEASDAKCMEAQEYALKLYKAFPELFPTEGKSQE